MDIPKDWTFQNESVAQGFDNHVRETLPWYELVTQAVALIARHYIGRYGLVYDIGASTGNIGRALSSELEARSAVLVPIEESQEMADKYAGPFKDKLIVNDALRVEYRSFDVAVCFLTIMFLPVWKRADFIQRLYDSCKPGGIIIIVDKAEARDGYFSTIMWRLTLNGKLLAGIEPEQIVKKELSLGGVQRPLSREELGPNAVEWFRFGDFAGWVIEKPACNTSNIATREV